MYGSVVGAGLLLSKQAGNPRSPERWGAASQQSWQRNGGGVLGRTWISERPVIFAHVALTKPMGIRRAWGIRAMITQRMDLWERGLHAGLVGDSEEEGAAREGRAASGDEEEDEAVARSIHNTVLSGKL